LSRVLLSFPTRRSSDLALAMAVEAHGGHAVVVETEAGATALIEGGKSRFDVLVADASLEGESRSMLGRLCQRGLVVARALTLIADRKSTRLNSSHVKIS